MKDHRELTFALLWFLAAAASFSQFVQDMNSAALTRCGLFLLMGVVYFHSFRGKSGRNNRRNRSNKAGRRVWR